MLAVRLDQPVGIDVEKIRDLPRGIDIAQTYFAPAESRALNRLRGTARRDAFFALWTHKEALVRALGLSLAPNLARLEFDLDPAGGPRLVARDRKKLVGSSSRSCAGLCRRAGHCASDRIPRVQDLEPLTQMLLMRLRVIRNCAMLQRNRWRETVRTEAPCSCRRGCLNVLRRRAAASVRR